MNRRVQPFAIPVLAMVALLAMLPARAQDNAVAAGQEVRIQQLEGQIRTLNGQLEQMNLWGILQQTMLSVGSCANVPNLPDTSANGRP